MGRFHPARFAWVGCHFDLLIYFLLDSVLCAICCMFSFIIFTKNNYCDLDRQSCIISCPLFFQLMLFLRYFDLFFSIEYFVCYWQLFRCHSYHHQIIFWLGLASHQNLLLYLSRITGIPFSYEIS